MELDGRYHMDTLRDVLRILVGFAGVFLTIKFYMIITAKVGEELGFSTLFEKCVAAIHKRKKAL